MSAAEYYNNSVPQNTGAQQQGQWPQNGENPNQTQTQGWPGRDPVSQNMGGPGYQNVNYQQPGGPGYEQGQFGGPGGEDEKGVGATLAGGAVGGFGGHYVGKKSDHGVLGTIGGAIAGAIVANMAEHAIEGRNSNEGKNSNGGKHGHHHGCHSRHQERRRERLERKLERLG